ncbi:hypothetical protein SD81_017000 [Tolypothrix campylonemoides VB511288]|nr:hypothetical protein SD81_017000 [Tolypothrix campylonemoides VB511288]
MSHQVFPEPDSQWRNIKKGTIYKVWMVATDVDSSERSPFVIHQIITLPKIEADMFTVCCSQTVKIGKVCSLSFDPNQWFLRWRHGVQTGPRAWARPLNLWHEKFELADS